MSEQATVQAIHQRPETPQPGSIPGVPEGYRIKKIDHVDHNEPYLDSRGTLQHWPYRETSSPYVHVVLEKIESEREAVLTITLTDDLRKILYHPKGFWLKANGCIAVDLDASCVEIRPKGATA